MSNVNWNDVVVDKPTKKRGENMTALIEGALLRPDLSGQQIASKLDLASGNAVSIVRRTAEVMVTLGTFRINGVEYSLQPVNRIELVKKPA